MRPHRWHPRRPSGGTAAHRSGRREPHDRDRRHCQPCHGAAQPRQGTAEEASILGTQKAGLVTYMPVDVLQRPGAARGDDRHRGAFRALQDRDPTHPPPGVPRQQVARGKPQVLGGGLSPL